MAIMGKANEKPKVSVVSGMQHYGLILVPSIRFYV